MPTNYRLNAPVDPSKTKEPLLQSLKRFAPFLEGQGSRIAITSVAILVSSTASLVAPMIIGHVIDTYVASRDYAGILTFSAMLLVIYLLGTVASYIQTKSMGTVGRQVLFNLRSSVFAKLQSLPVSFFNQNRSGDLISRINNDTDKLNQFISQGLIQFVANVFLMLGTGIFMLFLSFKLGAVTLLPAFGVLLVTQVVSPWVKRRNLASLRSLGGMSSDIQENLANFKAIVAFNRLDYFRDKFRISNQNNYDASIASGIASNIFLPIYGLASNLAQLASLAFGIYLISHGSLTIGLLIGFQFYVTNFYSPLRQIASLWSSFQLSLASLDRISEVLSLDNDMETVSDGSVGGVDKSVPLLEFRNVDFHYPDGKEVLRDISLSLESGKTYALVGPTGGGKTTTASIMARLYDPTGGTVLLDGKDIRSYDAATRTQRIGFILQEPFLFSGTVRDNVFYGNDTYAGKNEAELDEVLSKSGLAELLARFE